MGYSLHLCMSTRAPGSHVHNMSVGPLPTCVPAISYDHIIRKSKLFLVQIQLEMADLQKTLRFQRFPICQKNLLSSEMNPK